MLLENTATESEIIELVEYILNNRYPEETEKQILRGELDVSNFGAFKISLFNIYGYKGWIDSKSHVDFRFGGVARQIAYYFYGGSEKLIYCTFDNFARVMWRMIKKEEINIQASLF